MGEGHSTIHELIRTSWQMYARFERQSFLVKPSIPILFFGDSSKYFSSRLKVITLGLNPSKAEFPEADRFSRFDAARSVYPRIIEGACYDEYLQALNGYFRKPPNDPYEKWFNSFEPLLKGLDCSYYGGTVNTAIHTDLCSPLATDPTWSKLPKDAQHRLFNCGTPLWHSLVKWLSPDLIVASLARAHLERIPFPQQNGRPLAYTVERTVDGRNRRRPYRVELTRLRMGNGSNTTLVFGEAANTPFGTVSNDDKERIGRALRSQIYG
jgi:hypothetical protein